MFTSDIGKFSTIPNFVAIKSIVCTDKNEK